MARQARPTDKGLCSQVTSSLPQQLNGQPHWPQLINDAKFDHLHKNI
jgi:hypothetical protein